MGNKLVLAHTPFPTADLFNWKQDISPYRSTWTCSNGSLLLTTLLSSLLSKDEKCQAFAKTYAWYITHRVQQIADGNGTIDWPEAAALITRVIDPNPNKLAGSCSWPKKAKANSSTSLTKLMDAHLEILPYFPCIRL